MTFHFRLWQAATTTSTGTMTSICGFNRISKVHKLVVSTNSRICFSLSSTANQFTRLLDKGRSNHVYDVGKSTNTNRIDSIDRIKPQRYIFTSSTNTGNDKDVDMNKIDDFRAREERKEEEFAKKQEQDTKRESSTQTDEIVRQKILNAALPFVTTHGWTKQSLAHGAEVAGYPAVAHGLFPDGGIELIRHFYTKCNDELLAAVKEKTQNGNVKVTDPVEFTFFATKTRLQMLEPYISHWPQALAMMSLPQNVPTSLAQLLTLVDDICYYCGDRSVNYQWYVRRIGLATIFKMTEVFMLQDSSIDHRDTWNFLNRRLSEASFLQELFGQSDDPNQNIQKSLTAAFVTARNILGLGYNRR